jgi:histidinol-phosphate/aromatic aminotransferase/cobyric acid decarboxylase-like protein
LNKESYCSHGGRLHEFIGQTLANPEKRSLCVAADVLDAWYLPHESVSEFLRENISWLISTSPPCRTNGLKKELSAVFDLPSRNILIGAGSSDLIFRLLTGFFGKAAISEIFDESNSTESKKIGIVSPCYGEYAHVASNLCGLDIVRIFSESDQFSFSAEKLLAEVNRHSLRALCLVNPCNPTGQFITGSELRILLNAIPKSCIVFIDETYIEYIGRQHSVAELAIENGNIVVIESLSKTFALSGVRVGYAVLNAKLVALMDQTLPTYHISNVAIAALSRSLREMSYYRGKIAETVCLRRDFSKGLLRIEFVERVLPSVINSVLVDLGGKVSAEYLRKRLGELSVFVRNITEQGLSPEEADRYLRIAVLDQARNERILAGMRLVAGTQLQ